jgi:hypothetical protein
MTPKEELVAYSRISVVVSAIAVRGPDWLSQEGTQMKDFSPRNSKRELRLMEPKQISRGNMRQSKTAQLLLVALLCGCSFITHGSGTTKQDILRAAQRSYYNLPNQGLIEFKCSAIPDWQAILKRELKSDISPDHPGLKLLSKIHFWLSLDEKGSAKLTHQSDYAPTDEKSIANLNQTVSGMEEVLTGFSHTISPFLLTSPFPKTDGDYKLDEKQDGYQLSYRDGRFDVETTMRKDFAIVQIKVASPEFKGTITPQLVKTDLGFLMTSYEGTYQPASGGAMRVSARIDYKAVEGLQLPSNLKINTANGDNVHSIEFQFSEYQLKKR